MKRLEVRCCCQPEKLLGWMDVVDSTSDVHVVVSTRYASARFILPIAIFKDDSGRQYPAIKAEGHTAESLRLIPGFIKA